MDADLLRRGLKLAHLRLMAALADTGAIGAAADRLGMTQPAASRLLAEVAAITGQPLHLRDGRGLRLTPAGAALAARAARVIGEIALAAREVAELGGGLAGHVRVGAVTAPALDLVLPALRTLRLQAPDVTVEVEVAPSDPLAQMVAEGRLDFSLSRLPEGVAGLTFHPIAHEPVSLIARAGHPLAAGAAPQALLAHDWVLPAQGAPLRRAVLDRLAALGLPPPRGQLVTSSFLLTLAMLRQTNALAPLASAVARSFAGDSVVVLPDVLGITVAPFGLITRSGAQPTPAAERLLRLIRSEP